MDSKMCVNFCEALGIQGAHVVLPLMAANAKEMADYWDKLEEKDTLKFRWTDMYKPTAEKVMEYLYECKPVDYCEFVVVDCDTGVLDSEFALTDFRGKSARIHFSMRPGLETGIAIQLADLVTDAILNNWNHVRGLEVAYLESIYGVTPTMNRIACIFVLKAGFEKIGVLPFGMDYIDGTVSDAMLSYKVRRN